MTILKKLWTGESELTEVKTSYQYVLELRERETGGNDETCSGGANKKPNQIQEKL